LSAAEFIAFFPSNSWLRWVQNSRPEWWNKQTSEGERTLGIQNKGAGRSWLCCKCSLFYTAQLFCLQLKWLTGKIRAAFS